VVADIDASQISRRLNVLGFGEVTMLVDPMVTALAEVIVDLLRKRGVKFAIRAFGMEVKLAPSKASETIDTRLEKIETARSNLADALIAMDELKDAAEDNKRDLAALSASIERAEGEKTSLHGELESLKALAAIDSASVRKGLGLPTAVDVWRERIYGFLFGIVAAVIGAIIWDLAMKPIWEGYRYPPTQLEPAIPQTKQTPPAQP
jgi:hypothetical protein